MADETQVQSDESTQSSVEQSQTEEKIVVTKSAEELAKRLKEVSQEAKLNRQKLAEEKRKNEEAEKKILQEQGQYKELADIWQRKANASDAQANKLKQAFAYKTVADTIALEASRMGCVDTDAIVALLPMDQVPIDDTFNVDKESVRAMVEDFRKAKPYFFQRQAPTIANAAPAKSEPPKNDLSKMTLAERAALLAQLKQQGK
jgi:hypothetical protein